MTTMSVPEGAQGPIFAHEGDPPYSDLYREWEYEGADGSFLLGFALPEGSDMEKYGKVMSDKSGADPIDHLIRPDIGWNHDGGLVVMNSVARCQLMFTMDLQLMFTMDLQLMFTMDLRI